MLSVFHGDCLEVMRALKDQSVDSVITDPPYGLEFMGKEWDGADGFRRSLNREDAGRDNVFGRTSKTSPEYRVTGAVPQSNHRPVSDQPGAHDEGYRNMRGKEPLYQQWCQLWAAECLRVLKPGGHLLAFGGTRTYHRLACAIEDAGFEVRDSLHWIYGSGFPKGKACLKPAHEPIVMARKLDKRSVPLPGLDGCRVEGIKDTPASPRRAAQGPAYSDLGNDPGTGSGWDSGVGRWPPNILLTHSADCQPAGMRVVQSSKPAVFHRAAAENEGNTSAAYGKENRPEGHVTPGYGTETVQAWDCAPDCPVAELDRQSGSLKSGSNNFINRSSADHLGNTSPAYGAESRPAGQQMISYGDTGGASRFFPQFNWDPEYDAPFMYCAKAPPKERPKVDGIAHPTCKPLALMRWLVRLVTPPGGLVLDLFGGTGTTAEACILEGFRYVLIEREADYIKLIRFRLKKHLEQPSLFDSEEL